MSALEPLNEVRAPIFVNRGPELAGLADALDAVRASARRFVLISGEHGAGKSALCDAFVTQALATGARAAGAEIWRRTKVTSIARTAVVSWADRDGGRCDHL